MVEENGWQRKSSEAPMILHIKISLLESPKVLLVAICWDTCWCEWGPDVDDPLLVALGVAVGEAGVGVIETEVDIDPVPTQT